MPLEQQKPTRYDAGSKTPEKSLVLVVSDPSGTLEKQFHLNIALKIFGSAKEANYRKLINNIAQKGVGRYTVESPGLAHIASDGLILPLASEYTTFDPASLTSQAKLTLLKNAPRIAELGRRRDTLAKTLTNLKDQKRAKDTKSQIVKLNQDIEALEKDTLPILDQVSTSEPVLLATEPPKPSLWKGITTETPYFKRFTEEQNIEAAKAEASKVQTKEGSKPPKPASRIPKPVRYTAVGGSLTAAVAIVASCEPQAQVVQPGIYVERMAQVPDSIKSQIEAQTRQKLDTIVGVSSIDEQDTNQSVQFYFVQTKDTKGKATQYVMFREGDNLNLSPYTATLGVDNQGGTHLDFDTKSGEVFISYELNQAFTRNKGESDQDFQTRILTSLATDQKVQNTLLKAYKEGSIKEIKFRDPYTGKVVTITSQDFMEQFFKAISSIFNPFPQTALAQFPPPETEVPPETPTTGATASPTSPPPTALSTQAPSPTPAPTMQTAIPTPDARAQWQEYLNSWQAQNTITKYANAMGLKPGDVTAQLMKDQSDVILTDLNGNVLELRVDQQTKTPIFVKENGAWQDIGFRILADAQNSEIGFQYVPYWKSNETYVNSILENSNTIYIAGEFSMAELMTGKYQTATPEVISQQIRNIISTLRKRGAISGQINPADYNDLVSRLYFNRGDTVLGFASKNHVNVSGLTIFNPPDIPDDVINDVLNGNISYQDFENFIEFYDKAFMTHYSQYIGSTVKEIIPTNEISTRSMWDDNASRRQLINLMIKKGTIAKIYIWAQSINPNAIYEYNDDIKALGMQNSDSITKQITDQYIYVVNLIQQQGGRVDKLGVQAHSSTTNYLPDTATLIAGGKNLEAQTGVKKIGITEGTVVMSNQDLTKQASGYQAQVDGMLTLGGSWYGFGLSEAVTGYSNGMMLDGNYNPRLAYYYVLQVLYKHLLSLSHH